MHDLRFFLHTVNYRSFFDVLRPHDPSLSLIFMSFFETLDGRPLPPGQVYQPEECAICGSIVAMERFEAVATKKHKT
jgi:hypothetical protein